MIIEKLQQYDIALEEFIILNSSYTLAKGNRLHQQAHTILSTPPYAAICGGPYEPQLHLTESLTVGNLQRSVSYSSSITTIESSVQQRQAAPLLLNRQHSQRISTANNRRKSSLSPQIVDSNNCINNSETTNEASHRSIQPYRLTNTLSTTLISSQGTMEPVSPIIHNSGIVFLIFFSVDKHINWFEIFNFVQS